jgi:DNA-binding MarR family transcriptional regulator
MPNASSSFRRPSARRSARPSTSSIDSTQAKPRVPRSSAEARPLDTSALEQLLGYAARRTALTIIERFLPLMQPFGLRPVEFSILSVVVHNPGVTARQLCSTLGLQAPNLVAPLADFEKRGLLERHAHPQDGRAWGLHATAQGQALMREAHAQALALELAAAPKLSKTEYATLLRLLQKVYK